MALARFSTFGSEPRYEAATGARTKAELIVSFQLAATPTNSVGGVLPTRQSVFTAEPVPIPKTVSMLGLVPKFRPPAFNDPRRLIILQELAGTFGARNPQARPTNAPRPMKGPDQRGKPAAIGKVPRGKSISALAKAKVPGKAVSAAAKNKKPGQSALFAVGSPTAKTVAVASVAAVVTLPFLPGVLVL